jgi:hypothetical protein
MQLRWIAIGVVCFSAALLSACGNASGDMSTRSASAAMSKTDSGYKSSDKSKSDDDCDESEDSDKSSAKSKSLTMSSSKSKDDDSDECKSDDDHDKSSGHSYSKSMSVASKSSSKNDGKDHDKDDDATCKVTICHVPAGNQCKPHKIRVGKSEVRTHIEHGDYPGACDPTVPVDPPPPPPPQCTPDLGVCTTDAQCCTGSICMPDFQSSTGFSCGVAG